MAETLVAFTTVVTSEDGRRFEPRACGGLTADGFYEGWIEFAPIGDGEPIRTPRETLQPNRADLVYWATGLTQTYLDGALRRALVAPRLVERERSVPVMFHGPARPRKSPPRGIAIPRPVLNPFEAYQQGEGVLVAELGALDNGHLRDIVLGYGLASREAADRATSGELTCMIMDAVAGRGTADERRGTAAEPTSELPR
jgi:hypothetical protein